MRFVLRILLRVATISLLILAGTAVAGAQGAHVLQGKVIAPDGMQPRNPVRVKLTFNGRAIHETFTDLSGRFSFPGLSRGTYQLTADGDGLTFETTSAYVEISAFGTGSQIFTQDIQLRAIAYSPTGPPRVVNAFTQDVPPAARQAFDKGMKLGEKGQAEGAIEKLKEATKLFPAYFDAHLQLGNYFVKLNRLSEAITELDLAREVNPNDERAYQSFGLVLMKQRNYPVAVAIFEEAARLNPANGMNAVMRATALIYQASTITNIEDRDRLLGRAEIALTQAATLSNNQLKPDAITLASFYEMKNDPKRAADELENYLNKLPEGETAKALRAEVKRLREKARAVKPPQ